MKRPKVTRKRRREHEVELIIPADSAEYLDPRPHAPAYSEPIVVEGRAVPTNSPKAFHTPRPWSDARRDGRM